MRTLIAAAAFAVAALGAASAQDAAKGQQRFSVCAPCHAVGQDAPNKLGPELNGLDGRKAGSAANYNYSDAIKNSNIVWNEASFIQFVKDPNAMVPGNKMYAGSVKNEQDIKDLWAYVSRYNADGSVKE